jgi:hypothetical protein
MKQNFEVMSDKFHVEKSVLIPIVIVMFIVIPVVIIILLLLFKNGLRLL